MDNTGENKGGDPKDGNKIGDLKIQSENIAFGSDEMVACAKCGKSNPPNRASCLYCGATFEVSKERENEVRLNFRKLENWENGFNIVLLPPVDKSDVETAARCLKLDAEIFSKMLASKNPFPLARIESESEAELAVKQLSRCGLSAKIVSDIDLKIGKPNIRLRSVEFPAGSVQLTAFNTNEQWTLTSDEIVLIVVGRIIESKTESVEKGKKEKRKVLSETASASDEMLIDIYSSDSEQGWRVTTKGFDFSGLGSQKSLFAGDNIYRLLDKLKSFEREAKLIDEYSDLISPLTEVWDIERRTDFGGLKRTGVLKSGFATVGRTSNLEQFSRYSRLQRILL